jgi:hypothetical protein
MNRSKYDGVALSAAEKRIEDGKTFLFSSSQLIPNGGGEGHWLVRTGKKHTIVSNRVVTSNGNELEYIAYAGAVITDDGTPINIAPANIEQTLAPQGRAFLAPTFSSKGQGLVPDYLPGSPSGFLAPAAGNLYSNEQVNIIPPNTEILLEVRNDGDVASAKTEMYIVFTEVDDPAPFQ